MSVIDVCVALHGAELGISTLFIYVFIVILTFYAFNFFNITIFYSICSFDNFGMYCMFSFLIALTLFLKGATVYK